MTNLGAQDIWENLGLPCFLGSAPSRRTILPTPTPFGHQCTRTGATWPCSLCELLGLGRFYRRLWGRRFVFVGLGAPVLHLARARCAKLGLELNLLKCDAALPISQLIPQCRMAHMAPVAWWGRLLPGLRLPRSCAGRHRLTPSLGSLMFWSGIST